MSREAREAIDEWRALFNREWPVPATLGEVRIAGNALAAELAAARTREKKLREAIRAWYLILDLIEHPGVNGVKRAMEAALASATEGDAGE